MFIVNLFGFHLPRKNIIGLVSFSLYDRHFSHLHC